jgi:hypothetical protein
MRILYISDSITEDDIIRNNLRDISENDSIVIHHSFIDAINFIKIIF